MCQSGQLLGIFLHFCPSFADKPPWSEKNLTSYVTAMYFIATTSEHPALPDQLQGNSKDFITKVWWHGVGCGGGWF